MTLALHKNKFTGLLLGLTLLIAGLAPIVTSPTASADNVALQFSCSMNAPSIAYPNYANTSNFWFKPGAFCLVNGPARSIFQTDGNFVTYVNGHAVWASHTENRGATSLMLQADGNVVIYAGNTAIWNTHTAGKRGSNGNSMKQLSNGQLNLYMVSNNYNTFTQIW